jgi:hypothetical protein
MDPRSPPRTSANPLAKWAYRLSRAYVWHCLLAFMDVERVKIYDTQVRTTAPQYNLPVHHL